MYGKIKEFIKNYDIHIKRNIAIIATFVISVIFSSFLGYKNAYIWPIAVFVVTLLLLPAWKKITNKRVYAFLIAIFIGTSCFFIQTSHVYNRAVSFDGQNCTISGVVDDKLHYSETNIVYNIKVSKIDDVNYFPSFTIRANSKSELECTYGDKITFSGTLKKIVSDEEINIFDSTASKSIYLSTKVDETSIIDVQKTLNYKAPFLKLRDNFVERLVSNTESPQGSVIGGILFGKKDSIPYGIQRSFSKCGIAHILAFSGLHVNILSLIILFLLNLFRCPRRLKTIFMICALFCFAAMAGFTISALRACLMSGIVSLGSLFNKRLQSVHVLIIVAAILLFLMPESGLGLSFLLSFGSSLGILLLYRKIFTKIRASSPYNGLIATACFESISVSLSAVLFTLPVLMLSFGSVPVVTVFTNIIIIPFLPIIFVIGLLLILTSFISYGLASFIGMCASGLVGTICSVVDIIAKNVRNLPAYYQFVPLSIVGCIIIVALALYFSRRRVRILSLILCCSLIFIVPYFGNYVLSYGAVSLNFLGNYLGNSAVVRYDNKTLVVNCGGSGSRKILNYLDNHGLNKIDILLFTASDTSHAGDAELLLNEANVTSIILPNEMLNGQIGEIAKRKGIEISELELVNFKRDNFKVNYIDYKSAACIIIDTPQCRFAFSKSVNSLIAASREMEINVALYDGDRFDGNIYNLNAGYFFNLNGGRDWIQSNVDESKLNGEKFITVNVDENSSFLITDNKLIRGEY